MPITIKTEKVKLSAVKLNPDNPRRIIGKKMDLLVKSLQDFPDMMNIREIVIDETMTVLGGNMRTLALRKIGAKECMAKIVTGLTEAQKKEFIIKDNSGFGEWDMDLLSGWDDLPLMDWGIDLPKDWLKQISDTQEKQDTSSEYQALSPIEIDQKTQELIEKAEKIIFQFSGGKDSSLAIIKTLPLVQDKDYEAVYVDTGTEFPDLLWHIISFAEGYQIPLKILRPKRNFFEIYGGKKKFPDPIFRDCITPLINTPVDNYVDELKECLIIRGGRANQKTSKGKNDFYKEFTATKGRKIKLLNPMMYVKEEEYKEDIEKIPKWIGYERGFLRTACWCCPFQKPMQYEMLRAHYPLCWEVMQKMARTWEYPSHKGDGNIKRFKQYWDSQ